MKMEEKSEFRAPDRWLIASFIGGPSAWFLHLNLSYALVPESCDRGTKLLLFVITAVCLLIAFASAAIAWKLRTNASYERARWTADFALWICISMIVVIVAQNIPNLLLESCQ